MRIGIDARLINETGVGTYIRNLIDQIAKIDNKNEYYIYLSDAGFKKYSAPNPRWHIRKINVHWHTLLEQIVMPLIFIKDQLDLVHIPYFNIPIFYPGKIVTTIHDLTILQIPTGKASTLPPIIYNIKRLGYLIILFVGLHRAKHVIAVSRCTKNGVMKYFHIPDNKIAVTYEGISENLKYLKFHEVKNKHLMGNQYILYVGNAYPHKNLEILVNAFKEIIESETNSTNSLKLVLVGPEDYFYKKLQNYTFSLGLSNNVVFFGLADANDLAYLYRHASLLVFPSLMEGFGLPGLEAMFFGIPVVASDIPVFQEIYGDSVCYFNPASTYDLKDKINRVLENISLRKKLKQNAVSCLKKYNWTQTATQTLKIYNNTFLGGRSRSRR